MDGSKMLKNTRDYSKYIHILTILGLSTLIKHLTTSNDRLMTTNDLNSKIDTIPLCISNES